MSNVYHSAKKKTKNETEKTGSLQSINHAGKLSELKAFTSV